MPLGTLLCSTFHLPLVTCYLPLATCYLPLAAPKPHRRYAFSSALNQTLPPLACSGKSWMNIWCAPSDASDEESTDRHINRSSKHTPTLIQAHIHTQTHMHIYTVHIFLFAYIYAPPLRHRRRLLCGASLSAALGGTRVFRGSESER